MSLLDRTKWGQVFFFFFNEYAVGVCNFYEGIQENWLARLGFWKWKRQCLCSEEWVGVLQSAHF